MRFQVRCVAPDDAAVREQIMEAADSASLRAELQANGLVVLGIRPARTERSWRLIGSRHRTDYALFCREVRTLIKAGMTIVEAVDTLAVREQLKTSEESGLLIALRKRMGEGQALSTALGALPDVPAVLVAAVKAGERTSNLVEALDDYLRFETMVQQLQRKVKSAAIYPALVTVLGVGIALFLLLVVMPNFARMYQSLRAQASGANRFVIELSLLLSQYRMMTFILLALLVVALVISIKTGAAKRALIRWSVAIPWIRMRIQDFQLAMMYQALALLLKGGYPMTQAMAIAGQSALAQELRRGIAAAEARIMQGGSVAQALVDSGLCDETDHRLMAAAERNGDFYLAADVVSRLHGERFELFVERATRIVEPVLLLGVALLVGTIVIMMYLPVFDMATRLQ